MNTTTDPAAGADGSSGDFNAHAPSGMDPISVGVVILAAGASSRMGRPKLLMPWGQTTVLGHHLRVWRELGATQRVVVVAPNDRNLCEELDRLRWPLSQRVVNPDPARGMFHSIRCAAAWNGWQHEVTHMAITLGDQPHVGWSTLRGLLEETRRQPGRLVQPSRSGRPKHPVILPRAIFELLAGASVETLRDFLDQWSSARHWVPSQDAGLDLDLDEPADYEEAVRRFWPGDR